MEMLEILEEIDDPFEMVIVAMGVLAMKMVMFPIDMMFGDSMT